MKLGIGTAQWGLPYGVSNTYGVPSSEQIQTILNLAQKNDIHLLDTAFQYGTSEERIGSALVAEHGFRIVTKTPALKTKHVTAAEAQTVEDSFRTSLKRLHQSSVEGLLIHHMPDLSADTDGLLWKTLESLKKEGVVRKIGISVYTAAELDNAMARITPDIVQIPFNVLDQRLLESGHLEKLKKKGIEVHARSVFLQGLLLMEENKWPPFFKPWHGQLGQFHDLLRTAELSPLQGALQFVLQNKFIDCVVVGVASAGEFKEIIQAARAKSAADVDWTAIAATDETLLNPSRWSLTPQ